jgi:1-acyl-sn-glycerol-3-phosphate acyltransferase
MVTNHQSFLDPWLVGIAPHRQIHYMARDTLFKGGLLHAIIERLNAFPIKRGAADRAALSMAVERLDKGFIVNIFPEGTRSEDGTIGPIAPGMSIILNRCKKDVPIVPVVIDGAFAAWPRNRKMPKGYPIRLIHGKAIPASEWRKMSPEELSQRVRGEMVKLQEQLGSPYAAASRERLSREVSTPKSRRQR